VTSICIGGPAAASPPRPADLTVTGGDGWRADERFRLTWSNPPSSDPALVATHFRVRGPHGKTLEEEAAAPTTEAATALATPGVPGVYTAEVWLEDADGGIGAPASAQLRFDDARPGAVEPLALPQWLGRGAFPLRVRLTHPTGATPLSGIRGYAVSLDRRRDDSPCAADRCTEAETTLRGGIGDDELELGSLPDGATYLHAVAVSGTGVKSAPSGLAVLRVDTHDPVTRLLGAPPGWTNRAVWLTAQASDAGAGMTRRGGGPAPFTAIRVDGAAPVLAAGAMVGAAVIGEGVHRVAYYARDAAGNANDGAAANAVTNPPPRLAWVRIDRTPPEAGFANSEDPRDPDRLRVRVADGLSGPDLARGWIGVRRLGSGDRFERLPAAPPAAGELRARWRSDAYPRGLYELRAVAYDAAGNHVVTGRRRNGDPMVLASPLKAVSSLRAAFNRGRLRRAAPYGRRVRLAGRLTTGRSTPLAGVPVRVVERFAGGARPSGRASTVRTGPRGGFALRLARGPSRSIGVSFAGSPTLARADARGLELRVRSRVRLRASARTARVGGAPLVFRGRVPAAAGTLPAKGVRVELQFRLPGLPWTELRTIQTDRRGRFRQSYRFSDDDSRGVRFQFRAYVPAQENWPYEPGGSRPVLITGA
jgi:hypothetical protein